MDFKSSFASLDETFKSKMNGGVPGEQGLSAYEVAVQNGFEGTEAQWLNSLQGEPGRPGHTPVAGIDYFTDTDKQKIVNDVLESEPFQKLEQDIADLLYKPVAVTSVTNNVGTVELGRSIAAVTVTWGYNKPIVSQTFDGEALDISIREKTVQGPFVTNQSWGIKATDERGKTAQGSTGITFLNGVYYGVLTDGVEIDSAAIQGLDNQLQAGKGLTFTANAGSLQRIAYALPVRYGTPAFWVGGFEGGFSLAKTFDFKNGSEYTESYNVWLSDNTGLGSTTVEVK